jgi:hypothetical protein
VVNHWKPRRLGVTSRQSPLMTRFSRRPGSTLVLRLNQEVVHDFVMLFLPPCDPHLIPLATGSLEGSNQAYLSAPHLEASPTSTFRACSSPAPAPIKSQPAPAILSQESVHTTLSITHHPRKRPSTGPRTTQALTATCAFSSPCGPPFLRWPSVLPPARGLPPCGGCGAFGTFAHRSGAYSFGVTCVPSLGGPCSGLACGPWR